MSTGTSWQTVSRRNLKNRQSTFISHSYQNENDNTILPLSTQFNTTFSLFTQLNTTFSFSLSPTQHFAFSLRQKNFSFSLRPTQPFAFSLSPKTFLFHLFHSAQHNFLLRLKQFMLCVRASSRHKSFFFSVVCIGHYESGLQTDAVGTQGEDGTHDHGLFQVFFLFFSRRLWLMLFSSRKQTYTSTDKATPQLQLIWVQ